MITEKFTKIGCKGEPSDALGTKYVNDNIAELKKSFALERKGFSCVDQKYFASQLELD